MHEEQGQFELLRSRRFLPLFVTQFLGALNDNLFKASLTLWIVFQLLDANTDLLVNAAAGLFILPFFLLSTSAGQIADKVDKSGLIRSIKLAEIVIMSAGALAWLWGNAWLMFAVLLLLGAQSAFFGPSKYAILPQHLAEEELVAGNALLETGTFAAILLGTIFGGIIAGSSVPWVLAPLLLVFAVIGYLASRSIPEARPPAPDLIVNWNPATQIVRSFNDTRKHHYSVLLSILGVSWFWLMGSVYVTQIPNYVADYLNGGTGVVTLLLAAFSTGIGIGALLCDRLSGHKIEIGLVPFGALGLSIAAIHLTTLALEPPVGTYNIGSFLAAGGTAVVADLVLLSVFGAFFVVPLNAFVQQNAPEEKRARILALNNLMNALFMLIAAGIGALLLTLAELSIPQLFLVMALMNIAVSLFIFQQVPLFATRFLVWLLGHSLYRVHHEGLHNIPDEGPAIIACNHVSFVDALLLAGAVRRPIRFIMIKSIYDLPVLNFVFRVARTIPITSRRDDPVAYERAFEEIDRSLAAGDLLCIFPEGSLSPDGEIHEFRPGIEKIVSGRPVPVIPMALRGLWGSYFSAWGEGFFKQPFRRIWTRVDVVADVPWPPEALNVERLHDHVAAMRGDRR